METRDLRVTPHFFRIFRRYQAIAGKNLVLLGELWPSYLINGIFEAPPFFFLTLLLRQIIIRGEKRYK
jgi:hypothetical protein